MFEKESCSLVRSQNISSKVLPMAFVTLVLVVSMALVVFWFVFHSPSSSFSIIIALLYSPPSSPIPLPSLSSPTSLSLLSLFLTSFPSPLPHCLLLTSLPFLLIPLLHRFSLPFPFLSFLFSL